MKKILIVLLLLIIIIISGCKKEIIDKIPKLESTRGGMVNAELAIKAKKYGFKIAQVGVNHYPRIHGKPTGANIRVIIQSFIDLFKLWLKLR